MAEPARADTWMQRRGIPATEREWNAPWQRLQNLIAERYGFGDPLRRWERPDPSDMANLALLFRQASAAIDADVARAGASLGSLTPTECDVLRRIRDKPSAGTNLAQYLRLSPQRVSAVLVDLERRGLVTRDESARDARVRTAELTQAGMDVVGMLDHHLNRLADQWLDDLDEAGEDAKRTLVALVALLAELT